MGAPGVIGVLSVTGFPGCYTLRKGLTGSVLAKGTKAEVLAALAKELRDD